jgi:hypothetical protein
MLLTEFFNQPEGDSYADYKATSTAAQNQRPQATKRKNMVAESTSKVEDLLREIEQLKKLISNPRGRGVASMRKHLDQLYKDLEQAQTVKEDQWSGPNNAWHNEGDDQWSDGRGQWTESDENSIDTVTVDVPLLIRLLEYAREDAQTDMDLHNVAERAIELSQEGRTLTMDDYNKICSTKE